MEIYKGFRNESAFGWKKAVVTGASMGIGYAVAKELVLEGAEVTICASYELAGLAAGESGRLDIWINNVGTNRARKGELYTQEELDYLVGACFGSALFGCQAAFLHILQAI